MSEARTRGPWGGRGAGRGARWRADAAAGRGAGRQAATTQAGAREAAIKFFEMTLLVEPAHAEAKAALAYAQSLPSLQRDAPAPAK
jgi:hypothetical protein